MANLDETENAIAARTAAVKKAKALADNLDSWDLTGGVPGDLQAGLVHVIREVLHDYEASARALELGKALGLSEGAIGALAGAAGYAGRIIELFADIDTEEDQR